MITQKCVLHFRITVSHFTEIADELISRITLVVEPVQARYNSSVLEYRTPDIVTCILCFDEGRYSIGVAPAHASEKNRFVILKKRLDFIKTVFRVRYDKHGVLPVSS